MTKYSNPGKYFKTVACQINNLAIKDREDWYSV